VTAKLSHSVCTPGILR